MRPSESNCWLGLRVVELSVAFSAIAVALFVGQVIGQTNSPAQSIGSTPATVPPGVEVPRDVRLKSDAPSKPASAPAIRFFWTTEFDPSGASSPGKSGGAACDLAIRILYGRVREGFAYESRAGSASVAIVGYRGYRLPSYLSAPMDVRTRKFQYQPLRTHFAEGASGRSPPVSRRS